MTCLNDGSRLHPVARLVAAVAFQGGDERVQPIGPQPIPAAASGTASEARRRPARRSRRGSSRRPARPPQAVTERRLIRAAGALELGQPAVEDRPQVAHPRCERRRVGGHDAGAHRGIAARHAGSCPASRRPPARARVGAIVAARRLAGDALDQRGREHQRQVADGGHRSIVGRGVHPDDPGRGTPRQGPSTRSTSRRLGVRPATMTHGRSTNRPRVGRRIAGGLEAGHRVPAHEPQAERHRPARRSPIFVLATSVTTAVGGSAPATDPQVVDGPGRRSPGRPGRRGRPRRGRLRASRPPRR